MLKDIASAFSGPCLTIGDFNNIISQSDKLEGQPFATFSSGSFNKLIDDNDLVDLGFSRFIFTGNNRRAREANIQERLDRWMVDRDYRLRFPKVSILHLTAIQLDHEPILLNTSPQQYNGPKPFKLKNMWTRDPNAANIIEEAWLQTADTSPMVGLTTNLCNTKKVWNLGTEILLAEFKIGLKISNNKLITVKPLHRHPKILVEKDHLQQELEELLKKEEILGRAKLKQDGGRWRCKHTNRSSKPEI